MNKAERKILGPIATSVRKAHSNAWWELKRQIWDGGFQTYYPAQGEFDFLIDRMLGLLSEPAVETLKVEMLKQNERQPADGWREHYKSVVIEELVARARVAAYRTENW